MTRDRILGFDHWRTFPPRAWLSHHARSSGHDWQSCRCHGPNDAHAFYDVHVQKTHQDNDAESYPCKKSRCLTCPIIHNLHSVKLSNKYIIKRGTEGLMVDQSPWASPRAAGPRAGPRALSNHQARSYLAWICFKRPTQRAYAHSTVNLQSQATVLRMHKRNISSRGGGGDLGGRPSWLLDSSRLWISDFLNLQLNTLIFWSSDYLLLDFGLLDYRASGFRASGSLNILDSPSFCIPDFGYPPASGFRILDLEFQHACRASWTSSSRTSTKNTRSCGDMRPLVQCASTFACAFSRSVPWNLPNLGGT